MKGKALAIPLVAGLALALAGQTLRWSRRMEASQTLRQVELVSMAVVSRGEAPPQLLATNLEVLRRIAPLDPVEVGIPIALGTQYLFLSRFDPAARSYAEALALEPRPEGYLNLGRAQWLAGRSGEARQSFATAVRLDPRLAKEIPAAAQ
jgi:cytochrome c-type biogenesis protein CcmH/NrfG